MTHKDADRSSSGAASSPPRPVRRWALALSAGTGRLAAVLAPVAIVALLGGWVLLTDNDQRYTLAMSCLGVLTALFVLVMLCTQAAGKVWLSDMYAHALHRSDDGAVRPEQPLPRELPGGGFPRWRRVAYCVCLTTVAIGWFGLAAGRPERSPEVAWIDKDGSGVVHSVPIESLSKVRFDEEGGHYSSRITVSVPTRYGKQDAEVDITGAVKPQVGERVTVLYSLESPTRGVLVGDPEELLAELEGESFTTPGRWIFLGFWMAAVAGALALLRRDSRPGRHIRRIESGLLALRGVVIGGDIWTTNGDRPTFGTPQCLVVKTDAGQARFVVDGLGGAALAEALGRAPVRLVWNPGHSTRHFSRAVLVADEGWCLHGRLSMDASDALTAAAQEAAPLVDASRRVRLPDLRAAWPARTTRGVLVMAFLGLFFTLLMLQDGDWDMDSGQRWVVAVFASAFTWSVSFMYLDATKQARPRQGGAPGKPVKPAKAAKSARKPTAGAR